MAQSYASPGPYTTGKVAQPVTLTPQVPQATPVTVDAIVTYPSSGEGPFPVVTLFNGFQANAEWYSDTATQLASWGYVVLQYTTRFSLPFVTDRVEVGYLQPLLSWLASLGTQAQGPLAGRVDMSQLATVGHSRGGKLAALHYAGRSDVATAVLLDPVDNTTFTPESPDYPSAVKALAAANKTAGVVGAGISGQCNPTSSNYRFFFGAVAPGSWQLVINKAGHMQFTRTGSAVKDWSYSLLCGRGDIKSQDVILNAASFAVAWLEATFRPRQSRAALPAYLQWVSSQQAAGVVTYTSKSLVVA